MKLSSLLLLTLVLGGCGKDQSEIYASSQTGPEMKRPSLHELRTAYPDSTIWCEGFKDADCTIYNHPNSVDGYPAYTFYQEVIEKSYTVDAIWNPNAKHPTPPPLYLKAGAWECPVGTKLNAYKRVATDSTSDVYSWDGDREGIPVEPPKQTCTHYGKDRSFGIVEDVKAKAQ